MDWFHNLVSVTTRISEIKSVKSIRRGLMSTTPLLLIGAMALVLSNFPSEFYQDSMQALWGNNWKTPLIYFYNATYAVIALITLLNVSYSILNESKIIQAHKLPYILVISIVLSSYAILTSKNLSIFPEGTMGTTHIITALVVAYLVTNIFVFFYKDVTSKKDIGNDYSDESAGYSIKVIKPSLYTLCVVIIIKMAIDKYFVFDGSFITLLYQNVHQLGGFVTDTIYQFLVHLLWFFGIHGTNVLQFFNEAMFNLASQENINAVALGEKPTQIFTGEFNNVFIYLGGSGATLSLVIALLINKFEFSAQKSTVAKYAIIPAIFNVNEIILFGFPVILNPFFIIPFILTPIILSWFTGLVMHLGLLPLTISGNVPWTTPILFSGYLATGSIAGSLFQLVNLCIGVVIYTPFIRAYDKHQKQNHMKSFDKLTKAIIEGADNKDPFIERKDELGSLARTLAHDIYVELKEKECSFYMEFQPQITNKNEIFGAEALLRWIHPVYGSLPPPVIVRLVDELKINDALTEFTLDYIHNTRNMLRAHGVNNFMVSLNLSPEQIKSKKIIKLLRENREQMLDFVDIEFEITENSALEQSKETEDFIAEIKNNGGHIAMDDFGVGHASLLYIKHFNINTLKLDKILVDDILHDINSQHIVKNVCNLCNSLDIHVIAEFVETVQQRDKLLELGCYIYQGYLYSKSLNKSDLIKYIDNLKS